ncbi:hypothetical protein ACFQ08_27260 [Streptosporangium algeriense]|uniref:PH domain-containing protein n=1 Tax=Streptosporangium algeriense TaxID=1682748 RepID=A0ABW3DWQ5_9ACTN
MVLRPQRPGWLVAMAAAIPLLLLGLVLLLIRMINGSYGSEGLGLLAFPAFVILLGVPAVWGVVYLLRRGRTMRLVVDGDTLRYVGWNGKGWQLARSTITRVHYVNVMVPMATKPTPWIILSTDTDDVSRVLWQSDWPDGLLRVWKQSGAVVSRDDLPFREVISRYPRLALPWWHRRPVLAGLLYSVVFIVYVFLVVMPFVFMS